MTCGSVAPCGAGMTCGSVAPCESSDTAKYIAISWLSNSKDMDIYNNALLEQWSIYVAQNKRFASIHSLTFSHYWND